MRSHLTIYVSGLYSGVNPQPGIGIARSLRQGFPDAEIVGVEYSNRCSGIHWHDFDRIWLQRPWEELDLDAHAREVLRVLDDGGFWISSIDLEIMWLAEVFSDGHHPNLLTPQLAALQKVGKPAIPAHKRLPVKIPAFIDTQRSDWELHAFCREHNWKVWLKGPYYEAVRTPTWSDVQHWRNVLSKAWNIEKLFLQAHVTGYEESVMLCAYRGEIVESVYMRKRDVTDLGKTWAGDSSPVPEELLDPLTKIIRDLNWTGGAEFEMVRDAGGQLWLLELNPRFPAWVHGATITGRNLPAALVEAASGVRAAPVETESDEFTRVVLEIPVKAEFPLSPLPEPFAGSVGHSMKHPSGLIEFAQSLEKPFAALNGRGLSNGSGSNGKHDGDGHHLHIDVPRSYLEDLQRVDLEALQTPACLFFESTAASYFRNAADLAAGLSRPGLGIRNAYSIKTNPDERLIRLALENGFFAESISLMEAKKALANGFSPDQVILNGPAKWWRRETMPGGQFYSIFCDSIEELRRIGSEIENGELRTEVLGVRLRTPGVPSRFGVPIDSPESFEGLIAAIARMPKRTVFGVHFHVASSNVGVRGWWHLFESMLRWCRSIQTLSGRVVEVLDIGGGWFPEDLAKEDASRFRLAIDKVPELLGGVQQIITEPGKALAQPSMALAMQILEIRGAKGLACEVVVDGSIAELPMYMLHPHRILAREDGVWRACGRGETTLFGRLCMEHDIVASNVELPGTTREGDLLVFCDAGAYDRSMSYVFGCG
jgi:diaminopimelate decarboxylase